MAEINNDIFDYDKDTKTFLVKGKDTQFSTSHTLLNKKTGAAMVFNLSHSTGSEWDPKTIWVYEGESGFKLHIDNGDVSPPHANAYLERKLNNA